MDLILATSSGVEECVLNYDFDIDIGASNDFQVNLSYGTWDDRIQIGKRLYIPGTEYGGIIKYIQSDTTTGIITLKGFTWRGYLAHRFVVPPSGADYYVASGDLNSIIRNLVSIPGFEVSQNDSGASVSNYKFNRYIDMASGLQRLCESVGYRLNIRYVQTDVSGYVLVEAVKAGNYGAIIEYSQDSIINFDSVDNQMGVNHLICLGRGELKDRLVVHLYADKNGNISQTQTITGIDEVIQTFDNSGAEAETLIETGTRRLKEMMGGKSFIPSVKTVENELFIGDIVSGKDYTTGNQVTQPITEKIIRRETGFLSFDYRIAEPEFTDTTSTGPGGGSIFDMVYPVGSIYMSTSGTSPGVLFGGTWEQLQNCFLLGAGSSYAAGSTGGEASHTLTASEMPAHTHKTGNNGGHYAFGGGSTATGPAGGSGYATALTGIDTGSAGGGQAHNNLPPYLAVYMWKRTA